MNQLLKIRLEKGMTQKELSAKSKVSVFVISQAERHKVHLRREDAQRLAKALHVEVEELLGGEVIREEAHGENEKTYVRAAFKDSSGSFDSALDEVIETYRNDDNSQSRLYSFVVSVRKLLILMPKEQFEEFLKRVEELLWEILCPHHDEEPK